MATFRTPIITAAVAATLTAGCLYYLHHRRAVEAADLRRQNNQLRVQLLERHARDKMPAPAPARTPAVGQPAVDAVSASIPHEPAVVPNYRNEGNSTARAALQTFAWACDQGDAAAVGSLIIFDDAARVKATALFDGMPAEARGTWKSVDDMAADLLTMGGMSAPFPSADVLERVRLEELGADRVRLHLGGAARDGTEFQRTSQGWRYAITEAMVDGYVQRMRAGQARAP